MMYYETWTCQICNTRVNEDVYPCPSCKGNQNYNRIAQRQSKFKCFICTYENPKFVKECVICGNQLEGVPKQIKKVEKKIACPSCKQENDPSNIQCVFCENELYQLQKKQCPICFNRIKNALFDQHYTSCLLTREILEKQEAEEKKRHEQALKIQEQILRKQKELMQKELQECINCRAKLLPHEAANHTKQCRDKAMKALVFDQKTRLTPLQIQAMKYMTQKSEKEHNTVKKALQDRVKKLGYSIEDLNNLQFYIENYAPIIIHIHVSKHMQFFVKDTHYRSQFQTNKSSGSLSRPSRTTWEDRMFDKKYSKATDFQRCKYGVINFTNDPKGVNCCSGYGPSYFLLKQHVRQRCTFTDKDSSNADSAIATFKYCFKILSKMNDNQLKAAFDASKAKQVASNVTITYKQMQVHGPIEFSKDVQRIYVNRNEVKGNKKLLDMVYEFSKKHNVDHDFF